METLENGIYRMYQKFYHRTVDIGKLVVIDGEYWVKYPDSEDFVKMPPEDVDDIISAEYEGTLHNYYEPIA